MLENNSTKNPHRPTEPFSDTLTIPPFKSAETLFPLSVLLLSLLLQTSTANASESEQNLSSPVIRDTPQVIATAETDSVAMILSDQGVSVFPSYLFLAPPPPEEPFIVDGGIFFQYLDGVPMNIPGFFYRDFRNGPLTPGQLAHLTSQGYSFETYYPSEPPHEFACRTFESLFPGLECDWETAVTPEIYPRPEYFSTIGNYPNPFNGQTTLQFELPDPKEVRLSLYDLAGRKIKEENLGRLSAGGHSIEIELGDLPSGLCFAQFEFQSGNQVERFTHQMLEIK